MLLFVTVTPLLVRSTPPAGSPVPDGSDQMLTVPGVPSGMSPHDKHPVDRSRAGNLKELIHPGEVTPAAQTDYLFMTAIVP